MTIFIAGAWPYANGSLHIGHIAALLPGDILARYFRQKGEKVCYVSGSDCHGTPISIKAKSEKCKPEEIALNYHQEFENCFKALEFTYDHYSSTLKESHQKYVQQFILTLYKNDSLYEKKSDVLFCESCNQFLPDRFVIGTCPNCKAQSKGDQCDACGTIYDAKELDNIRCALCNSAPKIKESQHLYLNLKKFNEQISKLLNNNRSEWRQNAIKLTERYLQEGLINRAVTRDIDWGVPVPTDINGYEDKKIYVWVEAVLGYLSALDNWCEQERLDFTTYFNNSKHFYIHGKDNIPFHTIILPTLLLAHQNLKLPDSIVSSEYVTLEGKKISTSKNYAVWIKDLIEHYNVDTIRYFLTTNAPEQRDTDFSFREFINSHNGELLGAFGNLVNRSLTFINKYNDSVIPSASIDPDILSQLTELYSTVGSLIESCQFKKSIDTIFSFIRYSNKYFDSEQPWLTRTEQPDQCDHTLYNCVQIIANLSVLLHPFLPYATNQIQSWLSIKDNEWKVHIIQSGITIKKVKPLYDRIDRSQIVKESNKL